MRSRAAATSESVQTAISGSAAGKHVVSGCNMESLRLHLNATPPSFLDECLGSPEEKSDWIRVLSLVSRIGDSIRTIQELHKNLLRRGLRLVRTQRPSKVAIQTLEVLFEHSFHNVAPFRDSHRESPFDRRHVDPRMHRGHARVGGDDEQYPDRGRVPLRSQTFLGAAGWSPTTRPRRGTPSEGGLYHTPQGGHGNMPKFFLLRFCTPRARVWRSWR